MAKRVHHKFTQQTVDKLVRGLRMSMSYVDACNYAGISYDTFLNWRNGKFPRNLDDEQKALKEQFADLMTQAEGDGVASLMSRIQQGAVQGDWKAAAWILERRYPDRYGRPTPSVSVNVDVQLSQYLDTVSKEKGLTDIEREQLAARVEEHLKKNRKAVS